MRIISLNQQGFQNYQSGVAARQTSDWERKVPVPGQTVLSDRATWSGMSPISLTVGSSYTLTHYQQGGNTQQPTQLFVPTWAKVEGQSVQTTPC